MEMPMGEAVTWLARQRPEAPAVTDAHGTVTRADLDRRTNALARWFRALGVCRDRLVTIALPNGVHVVEACVAAWKLGAVPQPLSPRLPRPEQVQVLGLADPALVVGRGFEWLDRPTVPDLRALPVGLSDGALPAAVATHWKAPTSGGSTGTPKLILAGQPSIIDPATSVGYELPVGATQLVAGPLHHNGPFIYALRGLLTGGHLVVMERFDAGRWLELAQRHAVAWALLVPTHMHRIWRLSPTQRTAADLSALRAVVHLGAPCPAWLKRAWIEWLGPQRIFELYAGTEGIALTWISGGEWLRHPGSVGRPLYGEISVRDACGRPTPPGEVGEVWMRRPPGEPPSYRYVGAQARRLPGGWESLGDLGHLDGDGYLYLSDRRTDLIVRGGANVYPAEVEAALSEHPAVRSCAVVGLPDADLGQRVHAIVEADRPVTAAALRDHVAGRLVAYKVPQSVEFSAEPLRDEAGKVRRAALSRARTHPGA